MVVGGVNVSFPRPTQSPIISLSSPSARRRRFKGETAPLLFGDGNLDLKDPENPPQASTATSEGGEQKQEGGTTAAGGGGSKAAAEEEKSTSIFSRLAKYGAVDDSKTKSEKKGEDDKILIVPGDKKQRKSKKHWKDEPSAPLKLSEAALAAKPHVPQINPCLWIFHLLQGVAVVASLCLLTTEILPLILIPRGDIMSKLGPLAIALRVYISLFCVLFVLVESDLPVPFIRESNLLQRFFSRGFVYSFVGLICVEEAYSERIRDIVGHKDDFHVGWAAIFMNISSWFMLGTGALYMLMGVCCLKRLKDRLRDNEVEAWRKYRKDMKEWKELYE